MQMITLRIIETNGWSKTIQLEKAITRVGSAQTNDVSLHAPDIAPVHLQILYSPDLPTTCRVINLDQPVVVRKQGKAQSIDRFGACDLTDKDELQLGGFTLVVELPLVTDRVQKTKSIEASLSLSNGILRSDFPLEGVIVLKNAGSQNETQFQISIEGLPQDCYMIDPVPLLYPGAQEEVRIRLFHHVLYPEAGMREVLFMVSAPESYPGEEAIISQGLYVMPVFKQTLEIIDDIKKQEENKKSEEQAAVKQPDVIEPVEVEVAPEAPHDDLTAEAPSALPAAPTQIEVEPLLPLEKIENEAIEPADEEISFQSSEQTKEQPVLAPVNQILHDEAVNAPPLSPAPQAPPVLVNEPPQNNFEKRETVIKTRISNPVEDEWGSETHPPAVATAAAVQPLDRSKLKVMRGQAGDFWEEE